MHAYVLTTLAFLGLVTSTSAVVRAPTNDAKRIEIPLQGLDAERAPTLERALRALESEGEPPHEKLLAEVAVDAEKGVLELVVAPGQSLRLAQVQRALNASSVRIKGERFALGEATLVFDGELGEGGIEKLQRALTTELFAEAEVRQERDPERLVAHVKPGDEPPTFDSAAKAARGVAPGLRIADVVWTRAKER